MENAFSDIEGIKSNLLFKYLVDKGCFQLKFFYDTIITQIEVSTVYIIVIKVTLSEGATRTAGFSFYFEVEKENLMESKILELYTDIFHRIVEIDESYKNRGGYVTDIHVVGRSLSEIIISDLKLPQQFIKKDKSSTGLSHSNLSENDTRTLNIFPLNNDPKKLGEILKPTIVSQNEVVIEYVLNNKNKKTVIKKPKFNSIIFNEKAIFLLRKVNSFSYILVILKSSFYTIKEAYTTLGGAISKITDKPDEFGNISRTFGNYLFNFNLNNDLIFMKKTINLKPIKSYIDKNSKPIENTKLGVIDLEVYSNILLGKEFVYAAGLFTNFDKKPITFYLENIESVSLEGSENLLINLIEEMFKDKYKGIIFYCHNFGGYDVFFIIKALIDYNKNKGNEAGVIYSFDFFIREKTIIQAKICRTIKSTKTYITIADSFPILSKSLSALCKDFKVEHVKSIFPHTFGNEKTLFYIGVTPSIEYYRDVTPDILDTEYNDLYYSNN